MGHGDEFQKTLVEIYKSCVNKDEKGYGILLETGQLEPRYVKELIDKYNVYCICLGHGDLDKQGIIDLCRKNDKEKDWSYGISDEDLDAHAEKWTETNENLKTECPKYGIEYIDTHIDREEILNTLNKKVQYIELIEEFESMKTKESTFAKMCDKLEADIQCKLYCEENCIDINKKENKHLLKDSRVQQIFNFQKYTDLFLK